VQTAGRATQAFRRNGNCGIIGARNLSATPLSKAPMRPLLAIALCIAAASATATAAPQAAARFAGDHIMVTLVTESDALVPGKPAWVGLRLQHEPHWHTYWINPGDSGLATKLAWHLPEGFRAGDIAWPVPQRFTVGELYNFGYDGDVLLPVAIEVPAAAAADTQLALKVDAKWLVCEEQCIPGKATLELSLPIAAQANTDPAVAQAFAATRAAQPGISQTPLQARSDGERILVALPPAFAAVADIDAFALAPNVLANAPPRVERHDGDAMLSFAKSDYSTSTPVAFDLLLVPHGAPALQVRANVLDMLPAH
jgi:DsbC/DsbD-like thiol-disulfide interchange protein